MNMAKRLFALLLALILALGLTACAAPEAGASIGPDDRSPVDTQRPSAPTETQSLAETEEPSAPPEPVPPETPAPTPEETAPALPEDGRYNSKEEVALYLHLYGHLPDNYVTKEEAEALGWTGGSVERYAGEGTAIGGSRFGNYEGLLPKAEGRSYAECDIGTVGGASRGAKRLVYSNDGLIYYTEDHYESFELLYGEP